MISGIWTRLLSESNVGTIQSQMKWKKNANHACMNELFLGISYGEKPHRDAAQRNREGALNSCQNYDK